MYSTAGDRQKGRTKHNPQQAAKNPPMEAQKKKKLLNYQTWKFTVWKNKLNMAEQAEGFNAFLTNI